MYPEVINKIKIKEPTVGLEVPSSGLIRHGFDSFLSIVDHMSELFFGRIILNIIPYLGLDVTPSFYLEFTTRRDGIKIF